MIWLNDQSNIPEIVVIYPHYCISKRYLGIKRNTWKSVSNTKWSLCTTYGQQIIIKNIYLFIIHKPIPILVPTGLAGGLGAAQKIGISFGVIALIFITIAIVMLALQRTGRLKKPKVFGGTAKNDGNSFHNVMYAPNGGKTAARLIRYKISGLQ